MPEQGSRAGSPDARCGRRRLYEVMSFNFASFVDQDGLEVEFKCNKTPPTGAKKQDLHDSALKRTAEIAQQYI